MNACIHFHTFPYFHVAQMYSHLNLGEAEPAAQSSPSTLQLRWQPLASIFAVNVSSRTGSLSLTTTYVCVNIAGREEVLCACQCQPACKCVFLRMGTGANLQRLFTTLSVREQETAKYISICLFMISCSFSFLCSFALPPLPLSLRSPFLVD